MLDPLSGVLDTVGGPLNWLVQHDDMPPQPGLGSPPAWLSVYEVKLWRALKTDKRRRDWALGRRAAKQLLVELIFDRSGRRLAPDQIAILPHADGWPMVSIPTLGDSSPAVTLSISHSHERAFCAVIEGPDRPLGADIERIERRSSAFAEEYFTPLEQQFLVAAAEDQSDVLINAIWSGKEAALKAIRRGLAEDTRLVSCLPHPTMAVDPEWLPMRVVWNEDRITRPMPDLSGRWRMMGSFVLTLVYAS